MAVSIFIQLVIVVCLVVVGRRKLEDALPFFCFALVVMPLEAQLPLHGLFGLTTMRISLVTLLIFYLVRHEAGSTKSLPLKHLMSLHVAWAAMSTLYSISVATSAKQLLSQVMEFYLLYFLIVRIVTRTETIHKILFAVAMGISLCCVFAVVEAFTKWSILRIFPPDQWITYNGGVDPIFIEWGRGLRVRSTFPHPILFGDALAMTIPITLYLLSVAERDWKRIALCVALLLMSWSLYKTSSRGPWLGTGLCCLLLFVLIRSAIRRYLVVMTLAATLILVSWSGIWSSIKGLYTATTDVTSPTGTSFMYRSALNHAIEDAVAVNAGRALFGYGLGTFRERGLEISFLGRVHRWFTCDNNWAAFLYETGYIGLLLVGALLFSVLWIAWQSYRCSPEPENHLDGLLFVCLAGFYFMLLSVAAYSWGQQGYMAWILISLAVSHSRLAVRVNEVEYVNECDTPGVEELYEPALV